MLCVFYYIDILFFCIFSSSLTWESACRILRKYLCYFDGKHIHWHLYNTESFHPGIWCVSPFLQASFYVRQSSFIFYSHRLLPRRMMAFFASVNGIASKAQDSHWGLPPAPPWHEGLGAEDPRQEVKNRTSHFSGSLCMRQQVDPSELSWAERQGWPGHGEATFRIRESWVYHHRGRKREKRRCWGWLKLSVNTDVAKVPLSFCRADRGCEARRPESEPWPCHSLAVRPWASHVVASQKPCVLTGKIRVNSKYIFSCVIIALSLTGLSRHMVRDHMV